MSADIAPAPRDLASRVLNALRSRGEQIAAAESCTGGAIMKALTQIPGSSDVVWGGVIAYHNNAKTSLLEVPAALIERSGAVSQAVAKSMAWGIRTLSGADWTVSVTGIAGPDGGTREKPVGTVWLAWSTAAGDVQAELFQLKGNRQSIRTQAVEIALVGLLQRLEAK